MSRISAWLSCDKDGLPREVRDALDEAQHATAANTKMVLNIAVNYGGRMKCSGQYEVLLLPPKEERFSLPR